MQFHQCACGSTFLDKHNFQLHSGKINVCSFGAAAQCKGLSAVSSTTLRGWSILQCLRSPMNPENCTFWICCIHNRIQWSFKSREAWTSAPSTRLALVYIYVNERGDWQPKHTMSNIKRVLYVWEDQTEPLFMVENFDLLFNFEKEKCVFMLSLRRHKYRLKMFTCNSFPWFGL